MLKKAFEEIQIARQRQKHILQTKTCSERLVQAHNLIPPRQPLCRLLMMRTCLFQHNKVFQMLIKVCLEGTLTVCVSFTSAANVALLRLQNASGLRG